MRNIAIILAGGTGSRMGASLPKQFMDLGGRAVIEYSIDTFCHHQAIDEVAVVVHPKWRGELEAIVSRNNWPKLLRIIDGGTERYLSSLNAIEAFLDYPDSTKLGSDGNPVYETSCVNLLLHDAARPRVSASIINRVVQALRHNVAVGVAVPSTDTVWEVHTDMSGALSGADVVKEVPRLVARIPERQLMWRAQTPQAFRLPLIRDAYQCALQDPQFRATDDCSVVRHYMPGVKIAVVQGEESNRKITFSSDLDIAK